MTTPPPPLAPWRVRARRLVVDASPWLRLWDETVELPDGRVVSPYYALEQRDYVVVFARREDGRVLGQWRYKHGARRVNLGLPAGLVEPGEAPEAAARRELREETGLEAARWTSMGSFAVDGNRGGGLAHLFQAERLSQVADPAPDDLEEIVPAWLEPDELRAHVAAGHVATLGAAAAVAFGLLEIQDRPIQAEEDEA